MKKVFLVANEKALSKKRQKGVSMVSLVITIIVMLILAGIIFLSSTDSIEQAGVGVFVRELALVRQAASEKKLDNQIYGTSEENTYKGFYKTKIKNPPANFVSFSETEIYGYVIDLEYVHTENAERGHDYKRFATNIAANVVEFGVDDVYVLDKEGNIFYAKGWETDDGIHYSNLGIELHGPEIVAVNKIIAADAKSATISVVVRKKENGSLNVKVGDFEATRTQVSEDGLTETFEATVNENKTYVIIAEETGAGRSTSSIEVTELNLVTFIIKYLPNGTNVLNIPADQTKTEKVSTKLSNKIPERAGYTFLGWNENGYAEIATYRPGGEFIKDGAFDGDTINLFAIWKLGKEETYSVSYNANGGTNAPQGVENISGDYTITTQEPQRDGFAFLGWSKNPKATTAEYSAGATITLTENVTLYAVWSKGTYSVTVTTYPEGAGTVTGNALKPDGVEVFVTTTRNLGYVFKNWTVKSGGVNLSNSTNTTTSFTMPKNSVELVANYEVEEYIVKFNANRGTGAPSAQEAKYGEEIEIPTKKPTRAGYDFKGWALKQDANVATHQESQKYIVTQSVTFYAVWQVHIETYTLKFNLNGGYGNINGEIGKFVDQTKTEGAQIVIPIGGENEPYKEGFVFKGWALTEDSTDVVLRPGDTYSRDADLEIFALWKDETPPTITLEPKQEEGSDETRIVATAYDGGKIAEYAWTMSNTYPTAWQTDGISGETVIVEKVINQKGAHYFWAKDLTGNYTYQLMNAYEVKYDGMGGNNTPATQYQLQNTDLTLTEKVPSKERYVFLGWSIAANPGSTTADVNFQKGEKFNVNADTVLRAVWGEVFFDLSAKTAVTQIDGPNVEITVTKGAYTGEISVTSSDTDIATATITGNIITIVPGTKIGDVEITVVESQVGTTEKIVVTVERGIRKVSIDRTEQHFTYGDSSAKIEFLYNGKTTALSTTTSNATVATATASENTLTITPENNGTAIIGLVFAQDDQYLEKTVEVQVTVGKKQITITPKNNQSKVYDGTISTPTLTFTYTGNTGSEVPKFNGELTRDVGSDVGKYEIKLGSLSLLSNNDFIAENYEIVFSTTKVYFEITPKRIIVPTANTPQEYDGTVKEGIAEGEDYVRGGEYQKTNAGKYTAIATLKDTKNFVWDDTNTTNAKNIGWEITSINLLEAEAKVDEIPSQVYTGYELKPLPVVRCKGVELINGTDYTVSYSNNINVGYATITISGKGNYRGVIEDEFEIVKATMEIDAVGYNGIFDNQEHSIKVSPIWPSSGYTIYYSETQLTSSNYTTGATTPPKYKTPTNITTYYYIKAPNFNDYSGSANVKIAPKDIGGNISILGIVDKSYTGNEITQIITVKDNEQNRDLVENAEFTIAYSNNIKVGIATITLTGIGNYTGTKEATFNILGDVITISRNTEQLVTELEITITKTLPVGTLQYKINNGSWIDYTGKFTITEDCTIFAQSVHNGNVIGTSQLNITNICEHDYTVATCTEDSICKYCGLFNSSKLGHEYTSETATPEYLATAATCTDAAVYYHKCIRCTAKGTTTYEYGDPLGHEFTSETATAVYLKSAATCTEKAVYYHKCIRCTTKGTTTYAYGNPLGHEYTKKEITADYLKSEATCTEAAIYYFKCIRCDEKGTNTYTVGEPAGHDFTVQIINGTYLASEATCTVPAQYYYKCSKCDAKSTETYSYGEATGHSFGDFITITEANCIQAGSHRKTCQWCGTSVTEEVAIDPTNHYGPITYEDTVVPTCTTTGTRKYTCTACGEVVKYETLAALGHEWNAPEPPRKCNRCGLEENTIVQAIYTEGNGALTFVGDKEYKVGDTYNGYSITAVYNDIETEMYGFDFDEMQADAPWTEYCCDITSVSVKDNISPLSTAGWFYCLSTCDSFDLEKLDTSKVKNMAAMFLECTEMTTLDLSGWDTTNVTNMSYMFCNCESLTSVGNLNEWNTGNVYYMQGLFCNCASLESLDISDWNTSKVINMEEMFESCSSITSLDLNDWNTSMVMNMNRMFYSCEYLATLDISGFSLNNIEIDYNGFMMKKNMFARCYRLERVEIGENFSFDAYSYLPAPDSAYIDYANGKWYNTDSSIWYAPENIPNNQAATYIAVKPLTSYAVYSESDKSLTFYKNADAVSVGGTYNGKAVTAVYTGFDTETYESSSNVPWYSKSRSITSVTFIDEISPISTAYWFYYCEKLPTIGSIEKLNTAKVTDMSYMFYYCSSLTSLDVSGFDTGNVTNMRGMFLGCSSVSTLDVSNFYTSNVTDMSWMFYCCVSLTKLNVRMFITRNVTNMSSMFDGCSGLTTLDVSGFDTSKVTSMSSMFRNCSGLTTLDVSGFDTGNVTNMSYMFYNCSSLTNLDVSKLDTGNVTSMSGMFSYCSSLTSLDLSGFNTGKVTNMSYMFDYCMILTSLDLSGFDTGKVTNMSNMFSSCRSLTSLDLSGFDTGNVTNMTNMFYLCDRLTSLDVSGFNTSNVTDMECMFDGCDRLEKVSLGESFSFTGNGSTSCELPTPNATYISRADGKWYDTVTGIGYIPENVPSNKAATYVVVKPVSYYAIYSETDTSLTFYDNFDIVSVGSTYNGKTATAVYTGFETAYYNSSNPVPWNDYISSITKVVFEDEIIPKSTGYWFRNCSNLTTIESIGNLNTSNVTNMGMMFSKCSSLTTLDVSGFDTSKVSSMSAMFQSCSLLTTLDVSGFDTSKVTSMSAMFNGCSGLTTLDVSGFNTSKVTSMNSMFSGCSGLTTLDVSGFVTSKVTSMSSMFRNCSGLTTLDVSGFDTSKVTSMNAMFRNCSGLTTLDVSKFNTSNVTEMNSMFYACSVLETLDLSGFDTSAVTSMLYMFYKCLALTSVGNLNSWNTNNVTNMACMFYNCPSLTTLEVSGFDTSNVTTMDNMFYLCSSITSLDLSGWNTVNVTDIGWMFSNCTSLKTLNLSGFDTSSVTDNEYMFNACQKLEKITLGENFSFTGNGSASCTLPRPSSTYITGADGKWYDIVTGTGYTPANVPSNKAATYSAIKTSTFIQAIYQESETIDENTLIFLNSDNIYKAGDEYNGNTITSAYSGFVDRIYDSTDIPWYSHVAKITNVVFEDQIVPISTCNWFNDCTKLTTIESIANLDTSNVTTMKNMFKNCSSLTTINVNNFDTSKVINMGWLFYNCSSLTTINVNSFDTGNVTYMKSMFASCSSLTDLYLGYFDTSNVTNMSTMFSGCEKLESLYVRDFDTSNVTDMGGMFQNCSALKLLDVSEFNTSKVTKMNSMFKNCSSLNEIDVRGFDTKNVIQMGSMFSTCSSLTILDVSGFNTSNVTNMNFMFNECDKLEMIDVSGFNTSNVTSMSSMFSGCKKLETLDVSRFDTSNVTDMGWMFQGCLVLKSIDVSGFDTSNVTEMWYMFGSCKSLETLNLSSFDTSNVTDMSAMFAWCQKLEQVALGAKFNFTGNGSTSCELPTPDATYISGADGKWYDTATGIGYTPENVPSNKAATYVVKEYAQAIYQESIKTLTFVTKPVLYKAGQQFNGYTITAAYTGIEDAIAMNHPWYEYRTNITKVCFENEITPLDTSGWFWDFENLTTIENIENLNTSNVTSMSWMFLDCSSLTSIDVSGFDTSNVTDMGCMFGGCSSLTSIDVSGFDTSNVTDMSSMFYDCSSLTNLTLSAFDTSNVKDMRRMFYDCSSLATLNLTSFDTSKVTDMSEMFGNCELLKYIYVTKFDTSNVTDMHRMFWCCTSLISLNLSNWNTSKVTDMECMFYACESLTSIDASNFDTSNVTSMEGMFCWCTSLTTLKTSSLDTSKVTNMDHMFFDCQSLSYDCSSWNVSQVKSHEDFKYNAPGVKAPSW